MVFEGHFARFTAGERIGGGGGGSGGGSAEEALIGSKWILMFTDLQNNIWHRHTSVLSNPPTSPPTNKKLIPEHLEMFCRFSSSKITTRRLGRRLIDCLRNRLVWEPRRRVSGSERSCLHTSDTQTHEIRSVCLVSFSKGRKQNP